ncbi:MAG: ATP-binding cassette domain-containing protein [Deltaproteobacteria bacterium]|nr:ATP-binding cassette domain-containing protein [Deltaproteobacteria bacterium]
MTDAFVGDGAGLPRKAAQIDVAGVIQRYPADSGEITVLNGIDLKLDGHGINVLLGPSGCGKSTLMRLFGGFRPEDPLTPTAGTVVIDGQPCNGTHDDAVTVFQRYSNRPDFTVEENIRFPFRMKLWRDRVPKAEQDKRVEEILDVIGLKDKRSLYPHALSGGQNQRVAVARALVLRPRILLMDEPFGALDAQTRADMQEFLLRLLQTHACLTVFVTHDIEEAALLADRILVMSAPPSSIALDIRVTEPRPRDRLWLQSTAGVELQTRIRDLLHSPSPS